MLLLVPQQDTTFKPTDSATTTEQKAILKPDTAKGKADTTKNKKAEQKKSALKEAEQRKEREQKKAAKEKAKAQKKQEKKQKEQQEVKAKQDSAIQQKKTDAAIKPVLIADQSQESLFTNHQLKPVHEQPVLKKTANDDWFIYSVLGILVLFAIINKVYNKRFKQLTNAFFTSRVAGQLAREENVLQQRLTILLFITFILITSAFAFLASEFYGYNPFNETGLRYYFLLVFLILGAYVIKLISVKFLGFVMKTEKEISEYIFNIILFNNILGITLFPFVLCLAFSPLADPVIVIRTALVLTASLFIFRIFRGMVIGVANSGVSKFYLFIYLCTLELLPLVVIFKLLVSRI